MEVNQYGLFQLSVDDFSLVIKAPYFFYPMIQSSLLGWETSEHSVAPTKDTLDVYIHYDGTHFFTDALIYEKPIRRLDPIHALNDLFLTLVYFYAKHHTKQHLIHCAAYSDGQENILLLGNKKSGKSFLATQHGLNGGQFIADDLLLWHPGRGNFKAIGLPPRLRRPVHTDIMKSTNSDSFLVGHDLAYMKTDSYKGISAGSIIEFDRVRVFKSPHVSSDVKLHDYAKEIRKRQIRGSLWSIKKESLNLLN